MYPHLPVEIQWRQNVISFRVRARAKKKRGSFGGLVMFE
jgi:hypothetical protein